MSADELLDFVDDNDNVIGQMAKKDLYDQGLRNRMVNIIVIDPDTRKIAIQTRGREISWQPLHYCVSACGHVGAGEDWMDAAHREMKEEIGIEASLQFIDKFPFTCPYDKKFMMGIFIAEYPHHLLKADKREVDEIFSMEKDEIRILIAKSERLHNIFLPAITTVLEKVA